jgi:hypothetical protein
VQLACNYRHTALPSSLPDATFAVNAYLVFPNTKCISRHHRNHRPLRNQSPSAVWHRRQSHYSAATPKISHHQVEVQHAHIPAGHQATHSAHSEPAHRAHSSATWTYFQTTSLMMNLASTLHHCSTKRLHRHVRRLWPKPSRCCLFTPQKNQRRGDAAAVANRGAHQNQ